MALGPCAAHAQWLDYAQADTSSTAKTVVLVKALGTSTAASPAPLVAATYTQWSTGRSSSVGYTHRWSITGDPHQWIVGLGAGVNDWQSRVPDDHRSQTSLSARAQSEWIGPAPGGSYYALVQASSFRASWLATAQYALSGTPLAPEWTRYHERDYQATSLGLRVAVGVPRWFVRVGATHAEGKVRPYIGIAYNGF